MHDYFISICLFVFFCVLRFTFGKGFFVRWVDSRIINCVFFSSFRSPTLRSFSLLFFSFSLLFSVFFSAKSCVNEALINNNGKKGRRISHRYIDVVYQLVLFSFSLSSANLCAEEQIIMIIWKANRKVC